MKKKKEEENISKLNALKAKNENQRIQYKNRQKVHET
jgi:hypothetical protein